MDHMNFDEVEVNQLHAFPFQNIDLFQMKQVWKQVLPDKMFQVTNYSTISKVVSKNQLLHLLRMDLTLPFAIYEEGEPVFLYHPYERVIYSSSEDILFPHSLETISLLQFLTAHSNLFHDPDSFSLKMERLYHFNSEGEWIEFSIPKVKDGSRLIASLLKKLEVSSFQYVTTDKMLVTDLKDWAGKENKSFYLTTNKRWLKSNYTITCELDAVDVASLRLLIDLFDDPDKWFGVRFIIDDGEKSELSLFIEGDSSLGYAVGAVHYE